MDKRKASEKKSSARRKKTGASSFKKKLSNASLDWITNSTESDEMLFEPAESKKSPPSRNSKEKKIGILRQYVSVEAEKMKDDTPEVTPLISKNSFTIMKGRKEAPPKNEIAKKTDALEKEVATTKKEAAPIPADYAETAGGKKEDIHPGKIDKEIVAKHEKEPEVKTEKVKEAAEKDKEKSIPAENTPIEFGKVYIITEEKDLVPIEKEEESISEKKEAEPKTAEFSLESEVKKEDLTEEDKVKDEEKTAIPFKSVKPGIQKTVRSAINVSRHPVKVISDVDRKITQSMKKVVLLSIPRKAEKSLLKSIKLTNTQMTKFAKKLIDSILD